MKRVFLLMALSIITIAACSESSGGDGSWQSHRYTAKINESLDIQGMDRMTSGDRNAVCNALRTMDYDPNAYLDSAFQGQPVSESINFRRDFIIGVLLVMARPEGVRGYCR